jgi:hypothetical protein
VWNRRFGAGTFPHAMAGKHLKPLHGRYANDEIAHHLDVYLDKTPVQWINLAKFAMTFNHWTPDTTPLVDEDGLLIADVR